MCRLYFALWARVELKSAVNGSGSDTHGHIHIHICICVCVCILLSSQYRKGKDVNICWNCVSESTQGSMFG